MGQGRRTSLDEGEALPLELGTLEYTVQEQASITMGTLLDLLNLE